MSLLITCGFVLVGLAGLWWWVTRIPAVTVPPLPPIQARRAMLFNEHGQLDSVRTFIGPPPPLIHLTHGVGRTYRLQPDGLSDHWVYRA